jgi:pyruvate formate lyase activating enzyme
MTGRLFNIQRFSIHDGPGIRTTVFLKGCTLACAWCHNPESIAREPELVFFPHRCIGCRGCTEACPTGALTLEGERRQHRPERCRLCGRCADACVAGALVLEGREATVAEVIAEVLKDQPFYERSGGGVTLSGGEPLLQPDFAADLLARCRAHGLHTCLDTAAHAPWDAFEAVLPHTDLVLLDLKLMDPERHRMATGVTNEVILANARRLGGQDSRGRLSHTASLIVRVPIVPGWTDDDANLAAIAEFVRGFPNLDHVELLPYHRLAESKYLRLQRPYPLEGTPPPSRERLDSLLARLTARGLHAKLS